MEHTFVSPEMCSTPSSRLLLLPMFQLRTCSVCFPDMLSSNSKALIRFKRLKISTCAVLSTVELDPGSNSAFGNSASLITWHHEGFRRIPSIVPKVLCREKTEKKPITVSSKERLRKYSILLNESASKGSFNEGRAIHGHTITSGINPDSHLWASLINVYAKCGCSLYACRVLSQMPDQDIVSWTALIQGFVAQGYYEDAINLFCQMQKEDIRPNEFTLAIGLRACSMCWDIDFGKQLHTNTIKLGILSDLFVGSALVHLYAKCEEMELAEKVFFCMPEQNEVLWNVLLNGYAQLGHGNEVLMLFCKMLESKTEFSKFTLSSVLKGCANSGHLREGQVVHSLAIKSGIELDKFFASCLVEVYSKYNLVNDALKAFVRIKDHDVVSYTSMITCFDRLGHSLEVNQLFHLMRQRGMKPNQFTFSSLVCAATNMGDLRYGESIHACIWKYGFEYDVSVSNALAMMYMKNKRVVDGVRTFESIKVPDVVSWNALLTGFHDTDASEMGQRIFCQMLAQGVKPNMYTFVSVLRSCSSLMNARFGKQVHSLVVKNNFINNDFVGTALVDMYAKGWCMEEADLAFSKLFCRDVFPWTVIINGYAQTYQGEKAMKYFNAMLQEGVSPNEFTLAGCLSSCSNIASLESGRQFHSIAIKGGLSDDIFVCSSLVDMYAKCGCIEQADAIFKDLVEYDTVLWNTMICGLSLHGQGKRALDTFQAMIDRGHFPDEVTFIGVLSACSHMGLIEEGKKHFESMSTMYGITPTIDHYSCMVDILSQAGRFHEVEIFIQEMKLTPYACIWETVLGACAKQGNIEYGEIAAINLLELQPKLDTPYITLSNIFATKSRWEDVKKMRKLMSSQGIKKEPGCSWLEVNGHVHIFLSQDSSHPKIKEIHSGLEELGQKLRSAGYVPKTEYVLHNISDREKEKHLNHHSERLALAFALISTNPMKKIRIFKNLRMCRDCHDVMKLVSNITDRHIVVRDNKRFHHFKDGSCSCQDSW